MTAKRDYGPIIGILIMVGLSMLGWYAVIRFFRWVLS